MRRIDGSGTDGLEKTCTELAKNGWRLVNTAGVAPGVLNVYVYLFFERESGQAEA